MSIVSYLTSPQPSIYSDVQTAPSALRLSTTFYILALSLPLCPTNLAPTAFSNSSIASPTRPRLTLIVLIPISLATLKFPPISSKNSTSADPIRSPLSLPILSNSPSANSYILRSGFRIPTCADDTNKSNARRTSILGSSRSSRPTTSSPPSSTTSPPASKKRVVLALPPPRNGPFSPLRNTAPLSSLTPSGNLTVLLSAATTGTTPRSRSASTAGHMSVSGARACRIMVQNSVSASISGTGGGGLPCAVRVRRQYAAQRAASQSSVPKAEKKVASSGISPRSSRCQDPSGAVLAMALLM